LNKQETDLFAETTNPYLQDLYDHTIHIAETLGAFREIISGIMDLYLSNISNRMKEVMKILTIVATISILLSFIAGIYGMNFDNMPESKWSFGYPIALTIMALIGVLFLFYLKSENGSSVMLV
jgi:magnesium transporter